MDRIAKSRPTTTDYVLSMEDEGTVLAPEAHGAPSVLLPGVGRATIAHHYLKHDPPCSLELENAIAAIEEGIARARGLPAQGSRLRTKDPLVREIAQAAGLRGHGEAVFTLDAVEQAFQRLAARADRAPRPGTTIPAGNLLAATLVILRELMHHLAIPAIVVHFPSHLPRDSSP